MKLLMQRFLREESGATAVEYGLMVALIAVAIAVMVGLLGAQLNVLFQVVLNCIGDPTSANCTLP